MIITFSRDEKLVSGDGSACSEDAGARARRVFRL
jgi:hypothetical protein